MLKPVKLPATTSAQMAQIVAKTAGIKVTKVTQSVKEVQLGKRTLLLGWCCQQGLCSKNRQLGCAGCHSCEAPGMQATQRMLIEACEKLGWKEPHFTTGSAGEPHLHQLHVSVPEYLTDDECLDELVELTGIPYHAE
jgi:hypothetical protein